MTEPFGQKLAVAIRSEGKRLALLEKALVPEFALVALAGDELAGVAGYQTADGSFTGGFMSGSTAYKYLATELGYVKAGWAALILSLFERSAAPGELLMDGIAVRRDFRGRGIGSQLLEGIAETTREKGFDRVRLDVIDTNPRARKLYERKGFQAVKTHSFPCLRWLLGFGGSTTMTLRVG